MPHTIILFKYLEESVAFESLISCYNRLMYTIWHAVSMSIISHLISYETPIALDVKFSMQHTTFTEVVCRILGRLVDK